MGSIYVMSAIKKLYLSEEELKAQREAELVTLFKFIEEGKVDEAKEMIAEMTTEELNMQYHHETPLYYAVLNGRPEIVKALLEKRVDVEKETPTGRRAVHVVGHSSAEIGFWGFLSGKGGSDAVEYLVDAGANVNAQDKYGSTPLHNVAMNGYERGVEVLIANGADVNKKSNDGRTPIMTAETVEIIDMLEKAGADIHATSRMGETILHYAAHRGHLDVVKYLIEKRGFSPNQKDKEGETPLHEAMKGGFYLIEDTVSMLIKKGADVNITDNDGLTPLDYINQRIEASKASKYASLGKIKDLQECKRLLLKNGAKTSAQLASKEPQKKPMSALRMAGHQLSERDEMPVSRQTKSRA